VGAPPKHIIEKPTARVPEPAPQRAAPPQPTLEDSRVRPVEDDEATA
jgi:hypothetical protein